MPEKVPEFKLKRKADVLILMGSKNDWETMRVADILLTMLDIRSECFIASAHRTPERMLAFARQAESLGVKIIIAGAGGAAHLPGMVASCTILPVIAVPIVTKALRGLDSLLSIVQMPDGVPVGTMALDGASNAALYAARMLALSDPALRERLRKLIDEETNAIRLHPDDY